MIGQTFFGKRRRSRFEQFAVMLEYGLESLRVALVSRAQETLKLLAVMAESEQVNTTRLPLRAGRGNLFFGSE